MSGQIKKYFLAAAMALLIGLVLAPCGFAAVPAGGIKMEKPKTTEASYVALLFYKLTGNFPDFNVWAQQMPEYKEAAPDQKIDVLDKKSKEFENIYSLMTLADPITIEIPAKLSAYSSLQKGFLIETFKPNIYFGFYFLETGYAVIPKGIAEKQWLPVSPDQADVISSWTNEGREAIIQLTLRPLYADNKNPAKIEDIDYWLILADIANISLWSSDGTRLLWESRNAVGEGVPNKLLNLYR